MKKNLSPSEKKLRNSLLLANKCATSERGIEANPNKCVAIVEMRSPANVKEVQQLTERMAALSHFLSANGEKRYPYFQCLKKNIVSHGLMNAKGLMPS